MHAPVKRNTPPTTIHRPSILSNGGSSNVKQSITVTTTTKLFKVPKSVPQHPPGTMAKAPPPTSQPVPPRPASSSYSSSSRPFPLSPEPTLPSRPSSPAITPGRPFAALPGASKLFMPPKAASRQAGPSLFMPKR
ncbi:hypothetical protein T439DRAFT_168658 [Meredithblackwellia eburnea MCA 4105]